MGSFLNLMVFSLILKKGVGGIFFDLTEVKGGIVTAETADTEALEAFPHAALSIILALPCKHLRLPRGMQFRLHINSSLSFSPAKAQLSGF